ncbi:MAG: carboxypeptidase regulatory-like domain-containing protein [Blastocatellia bacterium]
MKRIVFLLTAFLFLPALIAVAQEPANPKREGAITGRVIAADSQPVAGARVIVASKSGAIVMPQMLVCDDEGNFKATGLNPGAYAVLAQMPGYVTLSNSSEPPRYRVGDHATITLIKGGVITGRVTDEFGELATGVPVHAVKTRNEDGSPERGGASLGTGLGMGGAGETDDRGVYRIYGVEPGQYVVSANSLPFSVEGMIRPRREQAIYYPSSPRSGATEIAVRGGEEVTGIDIRHRLLRGHAISGTLSGDVEGEGFLGGIAVILTSAASRQPAGMAMSLGDRKFMLGGVEDGDYDLSAMRVSGNMEFALSVPRRIRVGGADFSGIDLKLLKLGAITGRVVIESTAEAAGRCKSADEAVIEEILLDAARDEKTPSLFESLDPRNETSLGGFSAVPDKSGAFTAKNLEPGRVRLVADLPGEGWYVRAITQAASPKPLDVGQNGIAVKSGEKLSGVEVRIAEGAASLGGKLVPTNDAAKLPKRMRVHLIPAEAGAASDVLRYAETIVDGEGLFAFKHLAPGKYWLLARPAAESAARPLAWDAAERAKLRREAEAAKNEIDLKPCGRVTGHGLRVTR